MRRLLPSAAVTLVLCLFPIALFAADWLNWRGPAQNGVSPEKDLPDSWSLQGENLLWKQPYACRSTALVIKDRLYIIGDTGSTDLTTQERLLCLDANTGKKIWEHDFNVWHTAIVKNRLGWTNLAADPETGNIYAHGTQGLLMCLDKDGDGKGNGKVLWEHSLTEEYGRVSGYGGRNVSPVVDGDLVIIGMINSGWGDQARGMNRWVAFDKKTGAVRWWSESPYPIKFTYYSNPVVAVINGERLLITGGADGYLHAMQVRTGKRVWDYPLSAQAINASPVVSSDGKVYCSHNDENVPANGVQGAVICLDATKIVKGQPTVVWEEDEIKAGYGSPVLDEANNRLYIPEDGASLYCFDAQTGKKLWKKPHKYGKLARGSPVLADGKIYISEVNSKFHILTPGPKGVTKDQEVFFPASEGFVEINSSPAVVNGKIYFGTRDEFYCIGKKEHKAAPDKVAPLPEEKSAGKVAQMIVEPADVVLHPGGSQEFRVLLYDANGVSLGEGKPTDFKWTLPTPPVPKDAKVGPPPIQGEAKDGKLTVVKERPLQNGYVEAEGPEGFKARARVRVVPTLPIKYDFTKVPEGRTPAGWVNCAGRYAIEKMPDGTVALKKLAMNTAPPLSRANAYMNLPTLTDYTIQADVLGKEVARPNTPVYMPDCGVVANRYTLMLDGKIDPSDKKRHVRITSWDALPRVDKDVEFDWKPDVWYTLKLTVDAKGEKGHIRGKVWEAGKPEPKEWTIEFEDPLPNREGAPALYGYAVGIQDGVAKGTEIFYNNVSVTPNEAKK